MVDVRSRPAQAPATVKKTVCNMCSTGVCSTDVLFSDGKPVDLDIKGVPCTRGQSQLDHVLNKARLQYPMRRVGERGQGKFERISWDQALDSITEKLLKVRDEYGPEAVVFYNGYPKEPHPYTQRLAHAFGTPNYCSDSSVCFFATCVAGESTFGKPFGPFVRSASGIHPDTKVQLIWSCNPPISAPESAKKLWEAKEKGLKFIVVDPRNTETAARADIFLQPRPGTDGALALGFMHVIIKENLHDQAFVRDWTVGFDDLARMVQEYSPERVAEITGVPAEKTVAAARLFASNRPAKVQMSSSSVVHHSNGVQNQRAVMLLSVITGNLEVPGGNMLRSPGLSLNNILLFDQRIGQLKPRVGSDRFPAWMRFIKEGHSLALADQIETAQPYPIKAFVGIGTNVMMFPNSNRFVEALKKLDMLVFTDFFPTPSTDLGDVVLPAATYFESNALIVGRPFTPLANYVRWREPVIEPVGESWPDWKFVFELAKRLGLGDQFWNGDFEKCADYILQPSGITVAELKTHPEGMRVSLPDPEPRGYEKKRFATPSGKVEIRSSALEECGYDGLPVYKEPMESTVSQPVVAQTFPLVLTTGARLPMFTHSQNRNVERLRRLMPEPLVEVNPHDAAARGIADLDVVTLSTRRGSIAVKASLTEKVPAGVVSMSHGWKEANVNLLSDDQALDPISGYPAFKSQLCQVAKL